MPKTEEDYFTQLHQSKDNANNESVIKYPTSGSNIKITDENLGEHIKNAISISAWQKKPVTLEHGGDGIIVTGKSDPAEILKAHNLKLANNAERKPDGSGQDIKAITSSTHVAQQAR